MKKCIAVALFLSVLFMSQPVVANETKIEVYDQKKQIKSIVFSIGMNEYFVNGEVPGVEMDAAPFIESGRTFVPVRFLGNALAISNENITWDESLGRATLIAENTKVNMVIGIKEIVTNSQARAIDVAPQLKPPGRTFLPARFVCEALGYEVDWQDDRCVVIWPSGQSKPDVQAVKQYINQLGIKQTLTKAERTQLIAADRGYTIPSKLESVSGFSDKYRLASSGLRVFIDFPEDNPTKSEIGFLISIGNGTELQFQDAYKTLESKFGPQLAREIIVYAEQKKKSFDDLPDKYWWVNNQPIFVGSQAGDVAVDIQVWEPGVKIGI